MSEILFLAHRVPFPPDRGDKIRSHHILKALAKLAPVHVGCFSETAADRACEAQLALVAASWCMPRRSKPLPLAGIEALVRHEPVSLAAFRHARLEEWVRDTLARHDIDTIYVFSGQMGQYVPADWAGRLLVDLVDVDSAKFDAYAREKKAPMRWIDAREGRLLRGEEARLAQRADYTLLVSEAEAALLSERLPAAAKTNILALGNGIDTEAFDPAKFAPHPALNAPGPHIVFTGQMDYRPNIDAALRAIERLMPQIRGVLPSAQFHVVGRAPASELQARDGVNGSRVWGEVPDVRPFLAAADLVLAPLTIARGVQNKVLEAMAMARAVLLTSPVAIGLPGSEGEHFAVADTDAALVERALALLVDPTSATRMGQAARRLMVERMSWAAMLAPLPALLGRSPEALGQRDAA